MLDIDTSVYALDDHVLTLVAEDEANLVRVYRMHRPGTRMMSTDIAFFAGIIAISGDFCPCWNGVLSALGYGVGWFSGQLSPDYLCSKFLRKEYVPDYACAGLREWLDNREDYGLTQQQFEALTEAVGTWDRAGYGPLGDSYALAEFMHVNDLDVDDMPGWGYAPGDASALVAIQGKFASLMRERVDATGVVR